LDFGELVFEIGDNGLSTQGDRFRFKLNDTAIGVDKDVLIADYDDSVFNTNIIVNGPNKIGVHTTNPGANLDVHSAADVGFQLNGTGASPSILQQFLSAGVAQYEMGYNWNASADYRRFSIYDVQGLKEVISIDQQSRFVGVNYQYSSLADQPAYTFDVSGSGRFTDSGYFSTAGGNLLVGSTSTVGSSIFQVTGNAYVSGKLGVNVSSPTAKIDLAGQSELLRLINNDAFISFRNSTDATRYAYIQAQATALTISSDVGFVDFYATTGTMRLQTTGNLCINSTADNGSKLQVNGTATFQTSVTAAQFYTNGTQFFGYNLVGRVSDNFGAFRFLANDAVTRYGYIQSGSTNSGQINITGDGGASIDLYSRGQVFSFSASEKMRLVGLTGNLLIGTTTDAGQKLQVNGTSSITGIATFGNVVQVAGGAGVPTSGAGLELAGNSTVGNITSFNRTLGTYLPMVNNSLSHTFFRSGTQAFEIKSSGVINISNIPTSAAGLVSGDIYSNLGILTIVP